MLKKLKPTPVFVPRNNVGPYKKSLAVHTKIPGQVEHFQKMPFLLMVKRFPAWISIKVGFGDCSEWIFVRTQKDE